MSAERLEAEAHDLIARGHMLLAEAARLRATAAPVETPTTEWIPVAASPLGKRRTLALHRAGAVESAKVGRSVLVRRESLHGYIAKHTRDTTAPEGEDLFAERRSA